MTSPRPSPIDIQNHLYASFLQASTTDVSLHITSRSWEAIYRVHRVIVIQAGFFRDLFTGGFSEASIPGRHATNQIDITFDDDNITQAAFEICIARLYGGGPPLHVPSSLVPTTAHPLTPLFGSNDSITTKEERPPAGHHPATPRFLLSLLATSIYLSIPSLVSLVLNTILGTIGPCTALDYLNFARGYPISDPRGDEPSSAVGLEMLAHAVTAADKPRSPVQSTTGEEDFESVDDYHDSPCDTSRRTSSIISDGQSSSHQPERSDKRFYYGAISDKIGEAVMCWLARWAPDILALEQGKTIFADGALSPRPRSQTLPFVVSPARRLALQTSIPQIWGRGGLSAEWICALISSDSLFVKGERQRYDFARSIVEMRRINGIDPDEEVHWVKMFAEGIYYTNMTTEDLISISQDMSPTTNRPYLSQKVLQLALWEQAILRHRIVNKPASSPASTPPPREKELGIITTTAEILTSLSASTDNEAPPQDVAYYPVPADSSCRLGEAGRIEGNSMDQIFESLSSSKVSHFSEKNFFGIASERRSAASCISSDTVGKARWSPYAPFRFSIEFWDAEHLKEKSRLHSHTVWYAGSLFNVYVQVVRKKGVQLGVYLHRQSSVDPIPPSSSPLSFGGGSMTRIDTGWSHTSITPSSSLPSTLHYSPSIHPPTRSTTPSAGPTSVPVPGSPTTGNSPSSSFPSVIPSTAPVQPYRDPRSAISVYFSINVASAFGTSLTRFTSAPDVFSVGQSWGWKSSSTRTEEYLDIGLTGEGSSSDVSSAKGVSLRATIVLGIV